MLAKYVESIVDTSRR